MDEAANSMQSLSQNVDGIGSSLTEMEGLVQKQGRAADEAERKLATLEQGEFGGGAPWPPKSTSPSTCARPKVVTL